MSRLKSALRQLVRSRWFPTATKPILAGAIAAGLTYGLHKAGVTAFMPRDINTIASAVAGLLVTAIVQEPAKPPAPPGPVPVPIKVVKKAVIAPAEEKAEQQGYVG